MTAIEIRQVDYGNPEEVNDLCTLLNTYAMDPQGGGKAIDESVLAKLPQQLSEFPVAVSFLVYVDGQPAALANCFFGFSTFAGQRLLNIHDLAVQADFRGRGLSQKLLQHIEAFARDHHCCKLTLEVLDRNSVAMNAYRKFGFEGYELDPAAGKAVFWQKKLASPS